MSMALEEIFAPEIMRRTRASPQQVLNHSQAQIGNPLQIRMWATVTSFTGEHLKVFGRLPFFDRRS